MFCSKCGQQIADNAQFCSNCGNNTAPRQVSNQQEMFTDYQVMNSVHQYQIQKAAMRQGEMRTLDSLIMHFAQKEDQYDEYDVICEAVNHYSRGAKKGSIIWGAIFAVFGLLFTLISQSSNTPGLVAVGLFAGVFPGMFMIFAGIMMQIANKKNYSQALARWEALSMELSQHYMAYPNCPIGAEYSNPHILMTLRNTFQSGRADNIKECLNLMIADANQRAMENYMASIQRSTAQTAAASTATAIFMAASFFS